MKLAKRKIQPKYTIGSLLLLLAFSFYIACNNNETREPERQDGFIEKQQTKTKSKKAKKNRAPLRELTVFEGKVIGIKDGDTFEVLYDSVPEKVRLAEIDCPEKSQPFGKNARQYASDLCFGKIVTVSSSGKRDRYGRVVGTITTADGLNVNEELIKAGLAWHYKQYSKNEDLGILEQEAREKKVGLWADKNPQAPWEWRKERRMKNRRKKAEAIL